VRCCLKPFCILNPENPSGVCDEIYEKTGVKAMIIDASDIDCVHDTAKQRAASSTRGRPQIIMMSCILCGVPAPGPAGIDGLIDYDISFKEYVDYGILNPENPSGVCDEIYEKITAIPHNGTRAICSQSAAAFIVRCCLKPFCG